MNIAFLKEVEREILDVSDDYGVDDRPTEKLRHIARMIGAEIVRLELLTATGDGHAPAAGLNLSCSPSDHIHSTTHSPEVLRDHA